MRRILSLLILVLSACCYAQYAQLTNIPTIYIDTHNGESVTSKEVYIYADMVYVNGTDTVRYDSLKIRGRGNSTWGLAKKPYRIKFKESTKFLGKGYAKNKSWTLLANHGDKSLLRNAVTSRMGEFLGLPFNPAAHFVDLVLNGTYLGNYQVSDQVNVDNKRVEVFEQDYVANESSNISGGYLLEIDGFATSEPVYFRTDNSLLVTVKSPDGDVINTSQINYIRNYINSFETALFKDDFKDPETGYRAMLDSATVVAWYIATELSANVDGFWSTYVYKDKDDPKIYFGPLWDYDIAYNNCNRTGDVTNSDMVDVGFGSDLTKVWVRRFISDPWFNNAVNDAWKQKLSEGLEGYLYNYIDSMAQHIDESQEMNYSRYSIRSRAYNEIYLYSTYSEYINQLKNFIGKHAAYLTALFASRAGDTGGGGSGSGGDGQEELEPFELNSAYYYRVYNKGTNKVLDVAEDDNGEKKIVMWSPVSGKNTQLWRIEKEGNYYRLVNREEEMAFNDPSAGVVNTNLNLAHVQTGDERQLWKFVVVNENDNYNIINAATDLVINNSGGGSNDGNSVICYYNNDRNTVSNNRQWRIVPEEPIPDYVSEEVRAMLAATIEEAEQFLASLAGWAVGDAAFMYDAADIEALRRAVDDALCFESNVEDDYILLNVKLASLLDETRMVNVPSPTQQYVLRHRDSGYVLDLTEQLTSIREYDAGSGNQHFVFEQSGDEGKFFLKSEAGLYLSLGTANSWHMYGYSSIFDERSAGIRVVPMDGYYRIYAVNGIFATTYLAEGSKVYGNKSESELGSDAYGEWLLEEREAPEDSELALKAQKLCELLDSARSILAALPPEWVGDAPMQHSPVRTEALAALISFYEGVEYETVEEYDRALDALRAAIGEFQVLNAPDSEVEYFLRHASGMNLSVANGLTIEAQDIGDVSQRFRFVAVADEKNCYNIYSNGMYLCVAETAEPMFMFAETPHGKNGRFVATQTGTAHFTLTGIKGLSGVDMAYEGATVCPDAADNGENIMWELVRVPENSAVERVTYEHNVHYAVRYDRERHVIGFVSYDIDELASVDVSIHTVGGRLLYTFKASCEQSLADLPSGTYIISWSWAGRMHSVKFRKE